VLFNALGSVKITRFCRWLVAHGESIHLFVTKTPDAQAEKEQRKTEQHQRRQRNFRRARTAQNDCLKTFHRPRHGEEITDALHGGRHNLKRPPRPAQRGHRHRNAEHQAHGLLGRFDQRRGQNAQTDSSQIEGNHHDCQRQRAAAPGYAKDKLPNGDQERYLQNADEQRSQRLASQDGGLVGQRLLGRSLDQPDYLIDKSNRDGTNWRRGAPRATLRLCHFYLVSLLDCCNARLIFAARLPPSLSTSSSGMRASASSPKLLKTAPNTAVKQRQSHD